MDGVHAIFRNKDDVVNMVEKYQNWRMGLIDAFPADSYTVSFVIEYLIEYGKNSSRSHEDITNIVNDNLKIKRKKQK